MSEDPKDEALRLAKGYRVRCQCAFGEIRENVVWADCGDVVLVCSSEQFEHLQAGHQSPMPIGFRKRDVSPMEEV